MRHILRSPLGPELEADLAAPLEPALRRLLPRLRELFGNPYHSNNILIADLHPGCAPLYAADTGHVLQLFATNFQSQPFRHSHASFYQDKEWN